MTAPADLVWEGKDVDTTSLNARLTEMWSRINHEVATTGAVRTHLYNLVVYAADGEEIERTTAQLQELGSRRPSRAILLGSDRFSAVTSVDASIRVSCDTAIPGRPPLCRELVVIRAHGRAADHLASVVIPLLVPELRTYLWWPGQPLFGHRMFHRLLEMADQLVIDSVEFEAPGDSFANLVRLCGQKQGVNDFHWARLRPWRQVITQFFDGPQWAPYARSIRSIQLTFGGGGSASRVTSGTLLLLGWLGSRLSWEPETTLDDLATEDVTLAVLQDGRVVPIEIHFVEETPETAGRLMAVDVVCQPRDAAPARFTVSRTDDLDHARVCTTVHEGPAISRVVPLNRRANPELLADELELIGHDRLYEQVVDMASRMTGREVWLPA